MITTTSDRHNFIGGSEANMMYLNYQSTTFIKWWSKKLSGISEDTFTNKSMDVGTILEDPVIDLYEAINGVKGIRGKQEVKGIARANTDYIVSNKVSDVKVTRKAFEWFISGKVPIQYKRQLTHYRYVTGLEKASIIAYLSDEALDNPFEPLRPENLFEIPVLITEEEIQIHHEKIMYLEFCRDMNIYPV